MSETAAQPAKKRSRRKKKKNPASKVGTASETEICDGIGPKQSTDQAEGAVATSKCQRCKRHFRQFVPQTGSTSDSAQPWKMCPHCMLTSEEDKLRRVGGGEGDGEKELSSYGCNCTACVAKRESCLSGEGEREAQITQTYWMEIRRIVRCIYRENMTLESAATRSSIGSEKMRMIVKRLCSRDPHQFFQRLETLAREYLLEVKVRLLEQLSCGFNSPHLAIEFIQMLIDEYSSLASSLPPLLYLLEPLEESELVHGLPVTVEMMNKNIFRELIFAESFMSSNLPLIIAQLRLASLASDPYHRNTADALSQRYVALDQEMEEISRVWRLAKEHLTHSLHQRESQRLCEIKADGNEFLKMKNSTETSKNKHPESNHRTEQEEASNPRMGQETDYSAQLNEWSRLLFKCIRPIGEPVFRETGGIATHTVTLRMDMTELDLAQAQPDCCRGDLRKYQRMGMAADEVVEVMLKLDSLKRLGFSLRIDDLFDEQGFSLSDVNQALRRPHPPQQKGGCDDVFFIESDDEKESERGSELTPQEKAQIERAKERIMTRQESGNQQNRLNDFLQGITMKIRFMKRVSGSGDTSFAPSNGGKVLFSSCDQVQMKLTQLELSTARLVATGNTCVGSDLGLSEAPPTRPPRRWSRDECAFVHTDSHRQFMDLLLERRSRVDTVVVGKGVTSDEGSDPHFLDKRQPPLSRPDETAALSNGVKGHPEFTPVYLPNSAQPCQCSACLGAVAATITKENMRPLNPTDPSGATVTIQSSLDRILSRPQRPKKQPPSPPASKEVIWRKWMTTSGNSQLQSHSDHTHHHYHHHHHHHGDGVDGDSGYGDSLRSSCSMSCDCHDHTHHHSHDHHNGCPSPTYCTSVANGSSSTSSTTGAGGGEGARRYCPCCYCELFGNNGPPPIPTSHNFTKQRDKMRHKLEEKKKKEKDLNRHFIVQHSGCETDSRPLDDLIAFIEGDEEGEGGGVMVTTATNTSKATKKKKKAKKQPSLPATEEEESSSVGPSSDDVIGGCVANNENHTHRDGSNSVGGKVKGHSNKPRPPDTPTPVVSVPALSDLPLDDLSDDYDDELEAFKQRCFAPPVENRRRIVVPLDMNDLMAKMK